MYIARPENPLMYACIYFYGYLFLLDLQKQSYKSALFTYFSSFHQRIKLNPKHFVLQHWPTRELMVTETQIRNKFIAKAYVCFTLKYIYGNHLFKCHTTAEFFESFGHGQKKKIFYCQARHTKILTLNSLIATLENKNQDAWFTKKCQKFV